MSAGMMRRALGYQPTGDRARQKSVLTVLAWHYSDRLGKVWRSYPELMTETGLSRATIAAALTDLIKAGVLVQVGMRSARGPVEYAIALADAPQTSSVAELVTDESTSSATKPVQPLNQFSQQTTPVQPLNQSAAEPVQPLNSNKKELLKEGKKEEEKRDARKRTASPKTDVPADFTITDDMRAWAAEKGVAVDLDAETEQFLDHHRKQGNRFSDWDAAWRTWMRNTIKFAAERQRAVNGHQRPALRAVGGYQPRKISDDWAHVTDDDLKF